MSKLSQSLLLLVAISCFLFALASCTMSPPLLDESDIQTLAQSVFKDVLVEANAPGGCFASAHVHPLSKDRPGYVRVLGYHDIESKKQLNAESSLFRVGSISQIVANLAILQLQEKQKLSLSDPISKYLPTIVPASPFGAITIESLMSHTAGLEDRLHLLFLTNETYVPSLDEFLRLSSPHQIHAPNTFYSYSSHGISMLGLVIEHVTGLDFHTYVHHNIFAPLGMTHSSFDQHSASIKTRCASSYSASSYSAEKTPFTYVTPYPAEGLMTCAADASKLMMALLNGGALPLPSGGTDDSTRILNPQTIQKYVIAPHYKPSATLPPMSLVGFAVRTISSESSSNDVMLELSGDVSSFSSHMVLFPNHQFGYFVSQTSHSLVSRTKFRNHVLNTFFGPKQQSIHKLSSSANLSPFEGTYTLIRRPYSTHEQIVRLTLEFSVSISPLNSSILRVKFPSNLWPALQTNNQKQMTTFLEYLPLASNPLVFQRISGGIKGTGDLLPEFEFIEFDHDKTHLSTHYIVPLIAERISFTQSASVQAPVFVASILLFISATVGYLFIFTAKKFWTEGLFPADGSFLGGGSSGSNSKQPVPAAAPKDKKKAEDEENKKKKEAAAATAAVAAHESNKAQWTITGACALNLAHFFFSAIIIFKYGARILFEAPQEFLWISQLPLGSFIATAFALRSASSYVLNTKKQWGRLKRFYYLIICVALCAYLWVLWSNGLIGIQGVKRAEPKYLETKSSDPMQSAMNDLKQEIGGGKGRMSAEL